MIPRYCLQQCKNALLCDLFQFTPEEREKCIEVRKEINAKYPNRIKDKNGEE